MKIKIVLSLIGLVVLVATYPVHAGHDEQYDNSRALSKAHVDTTNNLSVIEPNQVVMKVHGIVCSFCSQGVKKKLAKFDFIDRSRLNEGILMNVENQRITVAIIEGKSADVQSMFAAVLSGGYEPIQALVADGEGKTTTINAENK